MSATLNAAALIKPCYNDNAAADASGVTGMLFRNSLAGAPASTTLDLPAFVEGCYLTLLARGCDVQYCIVRDGATAPTLVYDQPVTIGTGNKVAGDTCLNGIKEPIFLEKNMKQLVFMWSAATPSAFFEGRVSSARAVAG